MLLMARGARHLPTGHRVTHAAFFCFNGRHRKAFCASRRILAIEVDYGNGPFGAQLPGQMPSADMIATSWLRAFPYRFTMIPTRPYSRPPMPMPPTRT